MNRKGEERTRFQIGHKDGIIVMNCFGSRDVAPCHFTWTPEEARIVAAQLSDAAAAIDRIDIGVFPSDRPRDDVGRDPAPKK